MPKSSKDHLPNVRKPIVTKAQMKDIIKGANEDQRNLVNSSKDIKKYSVAWSEEKRKNCKLCLRKKHNRFCKRHWPRNTYQNKMYYSQEYVDKIAEKAVQEERKRNSPNRLHSKKDVNVSKEIEKHVQAFARAIILYEKDNGTPERFLRFAREALKDIAEKAKEEERKRILKGLPKELIVKNNITINTRLHGKNKLFLALLEGNSRKAGFNNCLGYIKNLIKPHA